MSGGGRGCRRVSGHRRLPDFDHDADGILDDVDSCHATSEDLDGLEDGDGCLDNDNDNDAIADLDALAKVLIENPDILELRLEGHTDAHGDTERNLEVSRQRAEAARSYLIARGVAPERLTLRALGDSEPRCDEVYRARETLTERECDAYNRRVEYKVVRRRLDNGTVFKQHP